MLAASASSVSSLESAKVAYSPVSAMGSSTSSTPSSLSKLTPFSAEAALQRVEIDRLEGHSAVEVRACREFEIKPQPIATHPKSYPLHYHRHSMDKENMHHPSSLATQSYLLQPSLDKDLSMKE